MFKIGESSSNSLASESSFNLRPVNQFVSGALEKNLSLAGVEVGSFLVPSAGLTTATGCDFNIRSDMSMCVLLSGKKAEELLRTVGFVCTFEPALYS